MGESLDGEDVGVAEDVGDGTGDAGAGGEWRKACGVNGLTAEQRDETGFLLCRTFQARLNCSVRRVGTENAALAPLPGGIPAQNLKCANIFARSKQRNRRH